MDFKSDKHIVIGLDFTNKIICSTYGDLSVLHKRKELEEVRDFIDSTLKHYDDNKITDAIVSFLNKKAKEEQQKAFNELCNSQREFKKKSGIYLISTFDNKYLKIGKAEDINIRLNTFKIGNPHKLKKLHFIEGLGKCESIIHSYFDLHRHEGEWFNYREEIVSAFEVLDKNKETLFKLRGRTDLEYYIKKILKN